MPIDNKTKRELFVLKKSTENPRPLMDFMSFMMNKYKINQYTIWKNYKNLEYIFNKKINYKDDLDLYALRKKLLNRWASMLEYMEFVGVAAFVINIDQYKSDKFNFEEERIRLENLCSIAIYNLTPEVLGHILFELACFYKNTEFENLSKERAYEAINFYNIVKKYVRWDYDKCNVDIALIYKNIFADFANYEKYLKFAGFKDNSPQPQLVERNKLLLEMK